MKDGVTGVWRSLYDWGTKKRKPAAYRTEYFAELPAKLRNRRLYVIGNSSSPWAVDV